ncbi:RNA polymerase-binding protein Rnk [Candidatus Moduliflexus flocculans]|uniref:RNA polymerase-binding protein Rnk n=1 Tax=Candidatus Moduliflexus flocculans TaxID=1499966 RepID=A0A081BSR9_9BACT|nr:RNA polymerase-binding protein Rnk [Candidatus Moduliflexus flocculans]
MEKRTIYITEFDLDRLDSLINTSNLGKLDKQHLLELKTELDRAEIVSPQEIPADVITMNSQVRLHDLDSGEEMVYTIVFPYEANIQQNKVSILAPVGVALIGYRLGDVVEWPMPGKVRRLEIKEILYQPEAAGDYHR